MSLSVQGSEGCATDPSAGLTNSHANTHLAVTQKSRGAQRFIIASKKNRL